MWKKDRRPCPRGSLMFKKSIFDKYLILPMGYDILPLGKRCYHDHDWSSKRKPPVCQHWGFSIPFLEQED